MSQNFCTSIQRTIVFTRYPQPGQTKTRLIPGIGARAAALLQRWMTELILDQTLLWQHRLNKDDFNHGDRWVISGDLGDLKHVKDLSRRNSALTPDPPLQTIFDGENDPHALIPRSQIEVCFSGTTERNMHRWLGEPQSGRYRYCAQGSGDLGDRMAQALARAWADGVDRAVIIGSDCPSLTAEDLHQAFAALDQADLVLGPAEDGGYYLLGMTRPQTSTIAETLAQGLFSGIPWSTDHVLEQTLAAAQGQNLRVATLTTYRDIDQPADLPYVQDATHWDTQLISAIVPTYNEAAHIATTLQHLETASNLEIILVDGGSTDATIAIARSLSLSCPFKIIELSGGGRARQCNAAAAEASGDILLFVHADTWLPPYFDLFLRGVLHGSSRRSAAIAGAFELRTDSDRPELRRVEWWANWRSRYLSLPYGDQAIFLKATTFHGCGGFPNLPIMDDYALVRQLARYGQIATLPIAVTTSARRWERLGIWKTTVLNQAIVLAYELGVAPDRLARWYRGQS